MYRNVWSCNRMDEYDDGPYWAILLMYGSHDMRHTGFRRLTVVNGTPGFWGVTYHVEFRRIPRQSEFSYFSRQRG